MTEIEKAEKEFSDGKITFNELRARKGLKPIEGSNILLSGEKKVSIIFGETGERFEIEKRVAIPMLEALRTRKRIEENPESRSVDVINTAKLVFALSETGSI